MRRFSEYFASVQERIEALSAMGEPVHSIDAIARKAEREGGLATEDVASLLSWGRHSDCRAEIHAAAQELREGAAGKTIEFVIPEYLTSFCQNDCLYCGYRKTNPLAERVRLTLDQYEKELDLILAWGHRQIELVLADDAEFGPDCLAPYVELTRKRLTALGGGQVALNAPPYEEADYYRLREAGLGWVALWQETYHQPHFDRWHYPGSRKRQFEFRLDVWDRAIAAGLDRVALGVLFGLYDWRYDVLALVEHGNYLRRAYGVQPYALGIPRLKPARGVLASQKASRFSVSDGDFGLAVGVYQMAFPRARVFFNTRESYEFNMSMLAGGNLFTVDCETLPGAYLRGRLPGQFSTHRYPPRGEVVRTFERLGYACLYLEPETPAEGTVAEAPARAEAGGFDAEQWWHEHQEIRTHLAEWESTLERLKAVPATERRTAAWALCRILDYFQTEVVEHCRHEESVLFGLLPQQPEGIPHVTHLREDHERFGVDLDRFTRQVVSYELSGDPTVLVNVGARTIREFRSHLDKEEQLFADLGRTGASPALRCSTGGQA